MKGILTFLWVVLAITANSQEDKASRPSQPAQAKGSINGKTVTVDYSSPLVKGRKIWGDLVPYNQVWRTGANETTSIEFSDDVLLEGKKIAKGKYALFTMPGEKEWVIIINRTIKWGAFSYKENEDVLRVSVPVKKSKAFNEKLNFQVTGKGVSLFWENAQVDFSIK